MMTKTMKIDTSDQIKTSRSNKIAVRLAEPDIPATLTHVLITMSRPMKHATVKNTKALDVRSSA